jgi:hypothetical protein
VQARVPSAEGRCSGARGLGGGRHSRWAPCALQWVPKREGTHASRMSSRRRSRSRWRRSNGDSDESWGEGGERAGRRPRAFGAGGRARPAPGAGWGPCRAALPPASHLLPLAPHVGACWRRERGINRHQRRVERQHTGQQRGQHAVGGALRAGAWCAVGWERRRGRRGGARRARCVRRARRSLRVARAATAAAHCGFQSRACRLPALHQPPWGLAFSDCCDAWTRTVRAAEGRVARPLVREALECALDSAIAEISCPATRGGWTEPVPGPAGRRDGRMGLGGGPA